MASIGDFLQVGETRGLNYLFWLTIGAGAAAAVVSAMVIYLALQCDPVSRMARLEERQGRFSESRRVVRAGYGTPSVVALLALAAFGEYLRRRLQRQHNIHPVDEYPYLGAFTAVGVLLTAASVLLNQSWTVLEVRYWQHAPEYAALPRVSWFWSDETLLMTLSLLAGIATWRVYKEG